MCFSTICLPIVCVGSQQHIKISDLRMCGQHCDIATAKVMEPKVAANGPCGYVRRRSGENGENGRWLWWSKTLELREAVLRVAQNRPRLRASPSLYILIHLLQAIYLVGCVRRSLGRGRQIEPAPAITSIPTRDGEAVDSKCYSNRLLALP